MVITIGRRHGSGGREIGRRLAQRLDIPCHVVDWSGEPGLEDRFDTIRELAQQGSCVIVGFCADYVLADREGLIRVFIHSDMDVRVQRVAERTGMDPQDAQRDILRQDRERAQLYGYYTKGKWADLARYDLTVDSGRLGISGTVELLSQFVALKVMRRRTEHAPSL